MHRPFPPRRACLHDAVHGGRCIGCDARVEAGSDYQTVCGAGGAGALGVKRVSTAPRERGGDVAAAGSSWALVFDLDETLVHAVRGGDPPESATELRCDGVSLWVLFRAGATDLIRQCARLPGVRLWVFTLGTLVYAREVVRALVAAAADIPVGKDGLGPFSGQVVARETSAGFEEAARVCGVHVSPVAAKGLWVFGMPPPCRCVVLDDRPENWVVARGEPPVPVFVPPPFTAHTAPDDALSVFLAVVQHMAPGLATGVTSHDAASSATKTFGAALAPLEFHLPGVFREAVQR